MGYDIIIYKLMQIQSKKPFQAEIALHRDEYELIKYLSGQRIVRHKHIMNKLIGRYLDHYNVSAINRLWGYIVKV